MLRSICDVLDDQIPTVVAANTNTNYDYILYQSLQTDQVIVKTLSNAKKAPQDKNDLLITLFGRLPETLFNTWKPYVTPRRNRGSILENKSPMAASGTMSLSGSGIKQQDDRYLWDRFSTLSHLEQADLCASLDSFDIAEDLEYEQKGKMTLKKTLTMNRAMARKLKFASPAKKNPLDPILDYRICLIRLVNKSRSSTIYTSSVSFSHFSSCLSQVKKISNGTKNF